MQPVDVRRLIQIIIEELTAAEAVTIVDTFIDTPMREPRYIRRLAKIRDLESRGSGS